MLASILVINNSETVLSLFKEILTEEGFTVHVWLFEQGEVLREIEVLKPDLLIIDCSVGKEGSGWQLLQQVRLDSSMQRLPIVICSTEYHLFDTMHDFLVDKRIVPLPKPFDIEDLLQTIDQAFRINQSTRGQAGDNASTFAQLGQ